MTKDEMRSVLGECLSPEKPGFQSPTDLEWQSLERRFSCRFPTAMRDFIDLMAEYAFPGDILNIGAGPNNGNDTIERTYDFESRENPSWSSGMVPFYSIGNGDYFCVSSPQCPDSPVFYYHAEPGHFEEYSPGFEKGVFDLPQLLG